MPTPDPQAFAKAVLWHLAGLRADVIEIHCRFLEHATKQGTIQSSAKEREKWKKWTAETRDDLYQQAIHSAGLSDAPPPPPKRKRKSR